ncbi:type IV secretion protein Dot [Legionella bononiensis]|uniref:Type IV secretion protein Dot n=1 Tax=Legionella bononiensis TaxID=2793102 RepID=A0ABS1WCH6_9GAMM|nr:type IV secretion protein Dot [Legionella bononiensis]MBL7478897.1 type IV secretion protein Dot [Legionella bononiensis]MBL7527029.1 type IV secretion protein Dot [Legionella bononiensis]MBL7562378.1 type IV secretion protein Dot [Legionella bononiensis]
MLTISIAKCLNATKNGSFKTSDLKLASPLTYDDMVFLSEYLRITPLTELDLSLDVTGENVSGLSELSKVVRQNTQLTKLKFTVEGTEFHLRSRDNLILSILNYFSNSQVRTMNGIVYDALVNMVKDKPQLETLFVNLELIETSASTSQCYNFAKNLQKSPLKFLDLNFAVDKNAELPILNKKVPNTTLVDLKLRSMSYGKDIVQCLQSTQALRVLVLDDMLFEASDIPLLEHVFKSNANLTLLALSNTNIGQIASPQLVNSLKYCTNLAYLDLSKNNLSRLNIDDLCVYLTKAPENLVELDLTHNTYMASDAKKLAEALANNKKIQKLIIDYNYIENEGLQSIIELLKTNRQITSISMSHNCRYGLSNETISALCSFLEDPECQLEELGFVQKTNIEQFKMLGDAIMANSSLVSVNINFHLDTIFGIIYKIQIQEHIDGLQPLIAKFYEQINASPKEPLPDNKPSSQTTINLEDGFFPNQSIDKKDENADSEQSSLQLN